MSALSRRLKTAPTGNSAWYEAHLLACMATLSLGFSLRVAGWRNMPRTGPVLIISNHQSFLDPMIVGAAVRREIVPLARKTLFKNRFFGALISSLNAVPIDQDGVGKEGIRAIGAEIQQGRAVLIFPEGERTMDGALHDFRPGIHLLLKRTPALIVPVGIAGAYEAWPRWRPYPIPSPLCLPAGRGTIAAVVGKPLDPQRYAKLPREQAMRELQNRVRAECERAEKMRRR
jgi:1-acyl-sn-glycerol-3-phosphate acyltransferase